MDFSQIREYNKNRKIYQIGYVVADMDAALAAWTDEFKLGPWTVFTHTQDCVTNRIGKKELCEEKFAVKIALTMMGQTQLELIAPVFGIPFFSNFLEQTGGGLHHIKEVMPNEEMDRAVQEYEKAGVGVLYGGEFFGARFCFLDTAPRFGALIELGNGAKAALPDDFPSQTYPPAG